MIVVANVAHCEIGAGANVFGGTRHFKVKKTAQKRTSSGDSSTEKDNDGGRRSDWLRSPQKVQIAIIVRRQRLRETSARRGRNVQAIRPAADDARWAPRVQNRDPWRRGCREVG